MVRPGDPHRAHRHRHRRLRDFFEIAGDCVTAVAETYGRTVGEEERAAVLAGMRTLPAHPEVPGSLARLSAAGFRLVALTNGPLASARAQLENAGLAATFEAVFSAEQAGVLKPASAAYRQVTDKFGIEPAEAIMVAAHGWDIAGATAAGMRTAFVARPGRRPLPGVPRPTWLAPDLDALADLVLDEPHSGPGGGCAGAEVGGSAGAVTRGGEAAAMRSTTRNDQDEAHSQKPCY